MTNAQSKPCVESKPRVENTGVTDFPEVHRVWIKEQLHALKAHKLADWQFEKMMELVDNAHANGWGKEMMNLIREVENERRDAGLSYTDIDAETQHDATNLKADIDEIIAATELKKAREKK